MTTSSPFAPQGQADALTQLKHNAQASKEATLVASCRQVGGSVDTEVSVGIQHCGPHHLRF